MWRVHEIHHIKYVDISHNIFWTCEGSMWFFSQHGTCEGFMWLTSQTNWTRHTTINSTIININWMYWKSQRRYVQTIQDECRTLIAPRSFGSVPTSLIWKWHCRSRWSEDQTLVGSNLRLGLLPMLSAARSQFWLGLLVTPSKRRSRMWRCRRGDRSRGHQQDPFRSRNHWHTCDRLTIVWAVGADHCWDCCASRDRLSNQKGLLFGDQQKRVGRWLLQNHVQYLSLASSKPCAASCSKTNLAFWSMVSSKLA